MTFRSLFIEEHDDRDSAVAAYVTGAAYRVFGRLDAYGWSNPAWAFAREHGLAVDYVDNAWLRVAVDAAMLRGFLQGGAESDAGAVELIGRVADGRWYVINEEEF